MPEESTDFYEMSLEEIRSHRGFSRRELSQQLGLHENSLYLIESRRQVPKLDTAIAIAVALEISLKQLAHSIGMDISKIPDDMPVLR